VSADEGLKPPHTPRGEPTWGLRETFLPKAGEVTDEEVVQGEDGPEERVAVVPGEVWDPIRGRPNVPAEILAATDLGGTIARIIGRELSHRDPPTRAPPETTELLLSPTSDKVVARLLSCG
jgi:hypothetical protein